MELWVRSQDKKNLVKVINQISLNYCDKKTIIANYKPDFIGTQGEYYEKMGTYKSEERALEVLDEIQSIIIGKYMCDINLEEAFSKIENEEDIKNLLKQMAVYEMPEE